MTFENRSNENSYTKSKRIEAIALAVTALSQAVDTEVNRGFDYDDISKAKKTLHLAVEILHYEMSN